MTPEDARRTVGETLARFGVAETAVTALVSSSHTVGRPATQDAEAIRLPRIAIDLANVSAATEDGADLVGHGELGRGGMGVVHLAEQRSLARDVAVKTILGSDGPTARALVREGRVPSRFASRNALLASIAERRHRASPTGRGSCG